MRRHYWLAVGGLVLAGGLAGWAGPPATPELAPYPRLDAEALKKQYPFVSLADRLGYERERTPAAAPPPLSAEAAKTLRYIELEHQFGKATNYRVRSLAMLHQVEVEKFTSREGFGNLRLIAPRLYFVDLPAAPPIPFPSEVRTPLSDAAAGPRVALPATANAASRLPALDALGRLHLGSLIEFGSARTNGLVLSRERVAGFESHRFETLPRLAEPPAGQTERWLVSRLELVSLLKHPQPVVYVSEHLPRMDALRKAQTRPLSDFEASALAKLQAGDDLAAQATLNRIYLMGAVRATSQCLDCHHAQRGQLLGTTSYELRRHPPLTIAER